MKASSVPDRMQANGGQAWNDQPSLTSLIAGVLEDVQDLLEQQFEYFRQEIAVDLEKTKEASYSFGLAGVFTAVGGILLIPALIGFLAWLVPELPWWGWSGILAILFLATSVFLYFDAWNTLKSFTPPLQRSMRRVKENVRWITKRNH